MLSYTSALQYFFLSLSLLFGICGGWDLARQNAYLHYIQLDLQICLCSTLTINSYDSNVVLIIQFWPLSLAFTVLVMYTPPGSNLNLILRLFYQSKLSCVATFKYHDEQALVHLHQTCSSLLHRET